jgi:predicted O-methyltransferase YrrM
VEFSAAREIALIADRNCGLADSYELNFGPWSFSADVGLHFLMSSSFGAKGRLLYNVVRFMRSERCLELGTAYGMSTFFILAALEKYTKSGCLATIEGGEPQFTLASTALKARYPQNVVCYFGFIDKVLPDALKSLGPVDFVFHDAGHRREDYIRDFDQFSASLAHGAVVFFDDIRWEKPKHLAEDPHSYEGWLQVVAHPRVRRAVEIDNALGLLFIE